jgi:hypothetical protein
VPSEFIDGVLRICSRFLSIHKSHLAKSCAMQT